MSKEKKVSGCNGWKESTATLAGLTLGLEAGGQMNTVFNFLSFLQCPVFKKTLTGGCAGADSWLLNTGAGSSRKELPCALGYTGVRVSMKFGCVLWFAALLVTNMWLDVGGLPLSVIWLVLIHQHYANLLFISCFLFPSI